MKENVVYRATCNKFTVTQLEQGLAPENIIERQYTGETARTIRIRAKQHKDDYDKCMRQKDRQTIEEGTSFMFDHHMEVHSHEEHNPDTDYTFHLVETFRDPMTRQLNEAARIQLAKRGMHSDVRCKIYSMKSVRHVYRVFSY